MTRIFCKPLSRRRGVAELIALSLVGVLLLGDATPVKGAPPKDRLSASTRLTSARQNRPLPLVHDATVSILNAPTDLWERPAGNPTALNPAAARVSHLTTAWIPQSTSLSLADTASDAAASDSVGVPTTTIFVSGGAMGGPWSGTQKPLPAIFSPF